MKKLLIGLTSYNDLPFLRECLPVLEQLRLNLKAQVVVMENAGNLEVQNFVREEFPKFELTCSEENLGYGASYSRILEEHPGYKYFLLVTSDVFLNLPIVQKFVQNLDEDDELMMCAGKLHHWDSSTHRRTNIIDSLGIVAQRRHHFYDRGQGEVDRGQYDEKLDDIFGLTGAAFLIRSSVLGALEGKLFDPRMWMYKEDIDLAYRLRWLGAKIRLFPEVWGWHARSLANHEGQGLTQLARADRNKRNYGRAHSYRNHLLLLKNNLSARFGFWVLLRVFVYEFMKGAYLFLRAPRAFFAGLKTLCFVPGRRSVRLISAQKMLKHFK